MEKIGLEAIFQDKNFQDGVKRYQQGIGAVGDATDSGASALSRIGAVAGGALTIGIGAAVAAFGALSAASKMGLDSLIGWKTSVDDMGDLLGGTAEEMSVLSVAMNHVGLTASEGGAGLNYFTRQLDDTLKLGKDGKPVVSNFTKALDTLGVKFTDSEGNLRSFNDIMPDVMDAFSKLPAGVNASALAMDMFGGRGGTKFLDFLRQGSAGLEDAKKLAEEYGLVLSGDSVDAVEEYQRSINDMNLAFTGIKNQIGIAVLPFAKQLMAWFNDALPTVMDLSKAFSSVFGDTLHNMFVSLNDDLQSGDISQVIGNIVMGMEKLSPIFGELGNSIISAGPSIQQVFEKIATGISPQATETFTMLGEKAQEIGQKIMPFLGEQFSKFSAWFTANEPLITEFISMSIRDFGAFASAVLDAWNVISPALGTLVDTVMNLATLIMQIRTGKWSEIWGTITKTVTDAWAGIQETALAFANWVASWVGSSWDEIVTNWSSIWENLKVIVSKVTQNILVTFQGWVAGIVKKVENIKASIVGKFNAALATVKSIWNSIGDAIVGAIDDIDAFVKRGLENIRRSMQTVWNFLFLDTQTKWNMVLGVVQNILAGLLSNAKNKLDELSKFIGGVWDSIKNAASAAWQTLVNTIVGFIASIPGAVSWAVSQLVAVGANIINSIKTGIQNAWYAATGIVQTISSLLTSMANYIISGDLAKTLGALGSNIISAIKNGLTAAWGAASGIVSILRDKLGALITDLWSGDLWARIQSVGGKIIDNIISGIQSHWQSFVDWLKNAIGNIFGSPQGTVGPMGANIAPEAYGGLGAGGGTVAQYSSSNQTTNIYNLNITSNVPANTLAADWGTIQAVASIAS